MRCEEVKELLLSYLDNEVSPGERQAIVAHLSVCPSCRGEEEALACTQRELRQGLKMIATGASPSPYAWTTIRERLLKEKRSEIPILNRLGLRIREGIEGLRSWPIWQKALAGALAVALIAGLCLTIPSLLGESQEAQAKDIAMEDPGVQTLLAEKGFPAPPELHMVAFQSDKRNIYHVQLMHPKDNTLIGTATVDVDSRKVIEIGLAEASEDYHVQLSGPPEGVSVEEIMATARDNAMVKQILDAGAQVSRISYLSLSRPGFPQSEIVFLELQLDKQGWVVRLDWTQREVVSILVKFEGTFGYEPSSAPFGPMQNWNSAVTC